MHCDPDVLTLVAVQYLGQRTRFVVQIVGREPPDYTYSM